MANNTVIIIGGGASGMVAAIAAARLGARVRLFDRMKRVGKKLLATGNGRCNLTNTDCGPRFYHGAPADFVAGVLDRFGVDATLSFFEELGIEACVESDGKVFPASYQASSVLDLLRYEMGRLGIEEVCDTKIRQVTRLSKQITCTAMDGSVQEADRIIVATGGQSSPNLGSNGGGYRIAERLGHRVVKPWPALVPLCMDMPHLKRLKGLKIEGAATIRVNRTSQRTERGEILFTEYGLSGPPVLQISRIAGEQSAPKNDVRVHLDLFPGTPLHEVASTISRRIQQHPEKSIEFSFVGWLHKRLVPVLLQEAHINDVTARCDTLGGRAAAHIAGLMKDWPLRCSGPHTFMNSQVTAGGVDTAELDPDTLESRLAPGVHFCGEVVDVDGDCGGYNLQWAWSSGVVAGRAACR